MKQAFISFLSALVLFAFILGASYILFTHPYIAAAAGLLAGFAFFCLAFYSLYENKEEERISLEKQLQEYYSRSAK